MDENDLPIDIKKFDKYLWDMKEEPLFGRLIADKLLNKDSPLRKEVLKIIIEAKEGKFIKT